MQRYFLALSNLVKEFGHTSISFHLKSPSVGQIWKPFFRQHFSSSKKSPDNTISFIQSDKIRTQYLPSYCHT